MNPTRRTAFGGIEAGGTKFVCAVGSGPDDLRALVRLPATTPQETLRLSIAFFREQRQRWDLAGIGIGSFGPVDADPLSPTFGRITSTPKPGWAQTDIVGIIGSALELPVGFDTDVNAAALGEACWGAAQGLRTFVYLTVGTGIGAGAMVNGSLLHGLVHPEMGHIRVGHDFLRDPYPGRCPFHGDCFEGLASGPAVQERTGADPRSLSNDHPAWALEAGYIAEALSDYICVLSPQRIILGGGIMRREALFPDIRRRVRELNNGYIRSPELQENIDGYIVPPGLGDRSGVLGAIALAQNQPGKSICSLTSS